MHIIPEWNRTVPFHCPKCDQEHLHYTNDTDLDRILGSVVMRIGHRAVEFLKLCVMYDEQRRLYFNLSSYICVLPNMTFDTGKVKSRPMASGPFGLLSTILLKLSSHEPSYNLNDMHTYGYSYYRSGIENSII